MEFVSNFNISDSYVFNIICSGVWTNVFFPADNFYKSSNYVGITVYICSEYLAK